MTRDKKDGIRAQLVRRGGQNYLWSRGEDLITERFPELAALRLPEGTVVDGEVLIWNEGAPAPFADLQKRIGRKSLSSKLLAELPAVLVAYDLLEEGEVDLRTLPQHERRTLLEALVKFAVRFPRILRKRDDKAIEDADSLDTLKGLLAAAGA